MSNISTLGFNCEYLDPILDNHHLGNGYRAYNPTTLQFTAPDDMSPFGHGGINPYMYVNCDPINNTDPSGHFNVLTFATGALLTGISALSLGGFILTTVITGGATSIPAIGAMLGSAYGMYSGIDQIISAFKQSSNVTGEQWKNFGINLGITVAAEFGGALLGAGIKALAPETSASIEGAIGRRLARPEVIVQREVDRDLAWQNLSKHLDDVDKAQYHEGPLNRGDSRDMNIRQRQAIRSDMNIQQAIRRDLGLPFRYAHGGSSIFFPTNKNDFNLHLHSNGKSSYSSNHPMSVPTLNSMATRILLPKIFAGNSMDIGGMLWIWEPF